jgi:phospholipid/cholesterol/gamma-HCH transport system substrate-binding protein
VKEVTRNFALGITSIIGALGLVVLLMLFGELDALIKPRYRILINTDNAAGLRAGSTVELAGVPIGTVDRIDMIEDGGLPVRIVVLIDEGIRIASDIVPFATSSPLGGSATLQLDRPRDHQPVTGWLAMDGAAEITAAIRSRLIQQARDALDNFIAPLVELARNLNRLLESPDPSDPDAMAASIRTTVVELNRSLSEIESLVVSLNEVFGAPDLSDPEAAKASVRTTIVNANAALEHYTSLAQKLEEAAGEAVPALTSLESALNEVQLLAHQARAGEGTIGQLMTNPDMFRSLQDTLDTLDELLVEMRVTVQRIRAEGINVHF